MRILFLSRWFPYPADNGSKIRIFNLLKQLAGKGHEIALISFVEQARPKAVSSALHQICTEIHTIPYQRTPRSGFAAISALLAARPRAVIESYNQAMAQCVCHVAAHFHPDLVIASQIDMAPYALLLRNTKRLLEELELTVLREAAQPAKQGQPKQQLALLRRTLTWQKHQRYVATTLQEFDGCTVVSDEEYHTFKQVVPNFTALKIVPNGVDLAHMADDFGQPRPNTLIYTGALTYDANLDAMRYFVDKIFPRVVNSNPAATLKITGSTTDVPVQALPVHSNLTLTGYLTELRPTIAQSYLSIVPLRVGGGTRLKILESLALGTPVITTSKGIEGLKIAHGEGILVADTPAAFADAILSVLQNPALRQQLSVAGRIAVQPYNWEQIGESLHEFIGEISQPMHQDRQAA